MKDNELVKLLPLLIKQAKKDFPPCKSPFSADCLSCTMRIMIQGLEFWLDIIIMDNNY